MLKALVGCLNTVCPQDIGMLVHNVIHQREGLVMKDYFVDSSSAIGAFTRLDTDNRPQMHSLLAPWREVFPLCLQLISG